MPASAPSLLDWLIALGTLGGPIVSAVAVLIAIRAQRQAQEAQFDQHRPMLIIVEEQSHLHTRDDLTTLNWAPGSQTVVTPLAADASGSHQELAPGPDMIGQV